MVAWSGHVCIVIVSCPDPLREGRVWNVTLCGSVQMECCRYVIMMLLWFRTHTRTQAGHEQLFARLSSSSFIRSYVLWA